MTKSISLTLLRVNKHAEARRRRARSHLPPRRCRRHHRTTRDITQHHYCESETSSSRDQSKVNERIRLETEHMLENGWCPHQVKHLSELYHHKVFSYLSKLQRSPHRLADHKNCSSHEACVAYNTDPTSYTIRHTTPDCACLHVSTPYEDLVQIIRQGDIPLISIEVGSDSTALPKVRVHSRSRESKYVAISHVWMDGMGNPKANSLPVCQINSLHANLLALQGFLDMDKGPILFWMDTLCIPVGREEMLLRLIQVDKMASIYKGAVTSLVLDAELMATVAGTDTDPSSRRLSVETRARLSCSVWMSRCWTLQEGELPPTITVQYLNTAVIMGRRSEKDGSYVERFTTLEVVQSIDMTISNEAEVGPADLLDLDPQSTNSSPFECDCVDIALEKAFYTTFFEETHSFPHVWNELAGRSTTMPEDVPLIVTNVMDLDNRELLKYHNSGDMFKAIILSLNRVPLSLFFNAGPRQSGDNRDRWVPVEVGADTLTPEDGNLTVSASYLLYQHPSADDVQKYLLYVIEGLVRVDRTIHLRHQDSNEVYTMEAADCITDQLGTHGYGSTCLIIENSFSARSPGTRRGACFYVPAARNVKLKHGFPRSHTTEKPELNLVFNCPVRLQRSHACTISSGDNVVDSVRDLDLITYSCDIKIHYEPMPNFKALPKRRKKYNIWDDDTQARDVIFVFIFLSVSAFSLGALLQSGKSDKFLDLFPLLCLFVYLGVVFTIAVSMSFATTLSNKLEAWRYVRDFEAIAAKRLLDTAV
ncbi:hypothetical protein FB567DRAFT_533844 [Paraphoma chrysanthemicola]|uniref:Heterokaryon incompatibility domain-containing protein n=1 Tax=Paraphoma chrysanthemicola TaxID=798071 RepID=A0A8K0QYE5_9PLEO|nr:hypothetical protein FB567DRAFT_533844 [Paraphoma chrysanthemicola]